MTSPLDTAVLLGKESTYGDPATLDHAYEAKTDPWKRAQEFIPSVGFRAGMQTTRSDRRKVVNMGAAGTIELDFMDRGMGFLLEGLLGSTTGPTAGSGSDYSSTHESDSDASGVSYTVQVLRPAVGGALEAFTYHGAVPTSWSLSHEVGGLLVLSIDFDSEDEDTATAAGTPSYAADAVPFSWAEAAVTVDGNPVHPSSFEVSADLGMKTDRRFLRNDPLKKQPLRSGVPSYTGSMTAEFEDTTLYDHFVAGDVLPLVATWEGALISGSDYYSVEMTLGAIQFSGESPEASLDDLTMQELPFDILDNGSDPAISIVLTNEDSAF